MGQMTYGLMYGIEDGVAGWDSDVAMEEFEAEYKDEICLLAEETDRWQARSQIVPEYEGESNPPMLGFFFAAGASGKDGVPYMETVRIGRIETDERYAEALEAARQRWTAFSAWCEKRGTTLPEPAVWLVETEVA